MSEPDEVMSQKGVPIQRKISVDYISFSAHVDYTQNSEFIELVKAQHVVRLLIVLQIKRRLTSLGRFLYMENTQRWVVCAQP